MKVLAILFLALFIVSCSQAKELQDDGQECTSEQDCVDGGKCSKGLECTCSQNKCYAGLIANQCTADGDCLAITTCQAPSDKQCFSTPYCNNGVCTCSEGCN